MYKKNSKYFNQLKSMGKEGSDRLLLLDHENDYVKYSAAAHTLGINENRALDVLNDLINKYKYAKGGQGIFCFGIEMLIKEWEKGKLKNLIWDTLP